MSDPGKLQLRWRGRITGPYSLEEILRQLDDHEIGLWHEIGQNDQWTPLGEFLTKRKAEQAREQIQARERQLDQASPPGNIPTRLPSTPPAPVNRPFAAAAPVARPITPAPPSGKARNRKLFVALGAVLGFTGAHNFYAGYWGTGLFQAILSIGTTLLGFGFIVSWLWALVELIVVSFDAQGRPMK
jgi:TM2 domain-containing membrane protein YozV